MAAKTGFVENKDKRRNKRVQGGWSSGGGGQSRGGRGAGRGGPGQGREGLGRGNGGTKKDLPHISAYGQFQQCPPSETQQRSYQQPMYNSTGYDVDYRGIGQPNDVGRSGFVYQTPQEVFIEKVELPKEKELSKDNQYTLSCTDDHGESRIRLFSKFIAEDEAAWIFQKLEAEVNWNRRMIKNQVGVNMLSPEKLSGLESFRIHILKSLWHLVMSGTQYC
ncbi:uncharacterized protein [Amphiura filiformis]|uniref:uncharacterized protein n=1 Tax=Amphiura filiformis TaxID=82378 RepID=UPI003B225555